MSGQRNEEALGELWKRAGSRAKELPWGQSHQRDSPRDVVLTNPFRNGSATPPVSGGCSLFGTVSGESAIPALYRAIAGSVQSRRHAISPGYAFSNSANASKSGQLKAATAIDGE
jgi:hypothetical protein